ncbi:AAA family ATPase [Rhodobacteraceae bacterium F11138]|nr:AAA family ATPase [Rhodobacteraceae bacterium F11138]
MKEALGTVGKLSSHSGERRQISVLSADLVGYTAIVEQLGEDKALPFTKLIYEILADAVQAHGGVVRGFGGDSVMAVFGIPEALEDAALRACRAALATLDAFETSAQDMETRFGVRPNVRVGVSSGLAVMASVEGEGAQVTAVGQAVNLASRIQALAPADGCLICDATRRQIKWLVDLSFGGEFDIRGVSRPHKLWRLQAIRDGATRFEASLARGLSHHVGRKDELSVLSDALAQVDDRHLLVDIVAEAGLGKTRLVFEFLRSLSRQDAFVVSGHCFADSQQVPFLPFQELVRRSFRIQDDDEPHEIESKLRAGLRGLNLYSAENLGLMLNLLGHMPPPGALDGLDGVLIGLRTRDLLPALLAARCRRGKVVLLFEDIHWIDGASRELLQNLIESDERSNLLILQTRRPEFIPDWRDHPNVRELALNPLTAEDLKSLMQSRLGVETLPDELVQQVTQRAGGNPLFGEEILHFLIEQGALSVQTADIRFDAQAGASALPASMQSLFMAKVDRLEPQDRALLQAAAVIGRRFDPGLLALVAGDGAETGVRLQRLEALDFIHRERDSTDYGFKHVMLTDTVYHSMLAEHRAELHLRIADAVEKRNKDRPAEVAEILAYHYGMTRRTDLAFAYNALAAEKGLGVFSLAEANRYFSTAFSLFEYDPSCASDERLAAFLANFALCLNISLQVKTMIELADKVGPILDRLGDNPHRVLFLHHYASCLVCNARYLDALKVQHELSAMAERLGDAKSMAYALVSELSVSCYGAPMTNERFDATRRRADAVLATLDDAYLQSFHLAYLGWNEVSRGRLPKADKAADRLMKAGTSRNDPRSLGYGIAMKALIAMISDDYEQALDLSEEALRVSRAEFERAIALAARYGAVVSLQKPGVTADVQRHVTDCEDKGWVLFTSGPDVMLGVSHVLDGRIDQGLKHIKRVIARREAEGYYTTADWNRLFLCEVYLEILSGGGGASPGVILRNIRALSGVLLFGAGRIVALVERVRANPHFDRNGHHIARCELILGLLYKIRKRKTLAIQHLTEAQRIVSPAGRSPMRTRIERALAELSNGNA